MNSEPTDIEVIYEDNHLLVVNKRCGELVQGDQTGDKPLSETAKDYIKKKYNKPGQVFLGVIHRLDRPTSGIVMFARTSKALERMNRKLRERSIRKVYWAVVEGHPDLKEQTLVHYLEKNPKNNKSTAFKRPSVKGKRAVLHYKTKASLDNYSLLEIELETGRHHQIRSQLASIGHPIKGDLKYGSRRSNDTGGIHLHAREIEFEHPVRNTEMSLKAPVPEDPIWKLCLDHL